MFTIRKCIEQMRKIGKRKVTLNNGTKIIIQEIDAEKWSYFGTIKWKEDGTQRVIRRFFCSIVENENTRMISELRRKGYWLYGSKHGNLFSESNYLIPERVMNEFISANNGINKYETITAYIYMMNDIVLDSD